MSALDNAEAISRIISKLQSRSGSGTVSKEEQDQLIARYIDKLGQTVVPGADDSSFGNTLLRRLIGPKTSDALFGPSARSVGQSYMSKGIDQEREALATRKAQLAESQMLVGGPLQKDLSPMGRAMIEKLGGLQTMDQTVPLEAAGPTRPIFQNVPDPRGEGSFTPDEFGGTQESKTGMPQIRPEVMGMIEQGGEQGNQLMEQLLQSEADADRFRSPELDRLMRATDPGLQAEETVQVEDPNAAIPESVMRQAGLGLKTELQTAKSSKESIPAEQSRAAARAILTANRVPDEEQGAILASIPDGLPSSVVNQMLSSFSSTSQTFTREDRKDQRAQEFGKAQDARIKMRGEVQASLLEKGSALSLQNNLTVKQVMFTHAQALQEGRIGARTKHAEEQDARRLENQLTVLKERQGFSKEENELNRAANYGVQVLRGEQALDLEGVRQLNRVALQQKKAGESQLDSVKKFYGDFMKANPAVAGQLLDILSSGEGVDDPFTDEGIREALSERFKSIVDSQVVGERIRATVDTDIYGNTMPEKMSSLHAAKMRFLKGDPANGIPPMSLEEVQAIDDQIEAMREFTKAGAQSVNVKIGPDEKPMGTQEATRFSALSQSFVELTTVKDLLFDDDGGIKRTNIATSTSLLGLDGLPFSEGREMLQALKNAVEARLRAESGAAVPETEVVRAAERFIPNNLDSDRSIRAKVKRLEEFLTEAMSLVDPTGVQRKRGAKGTPIESLSEPAKQKDVQSRGDELKARGLTNEQILKQLEKEGF